jgi:hypothetical protein
MLARLVNDRMRELGMARARELADKADVSFGVVRYLALIRPAPHELERLSVALKWPPRYLADLWARRGWRTYPRTYS